MITDELYTYFLNHRNILEKNKFKFSENYNDVYDDVYNNVYEDLYGDVFDDIQENIQANIQDDIVDDVYLVQCLSKENPDVDTNDTMRSI